MPPSLLTLSPALFAFSLAMVLFIFLLNPLITWLLFKLKGPKTVRTGRINPSVSLLIIARNAEELVLEKLKNSLALAYPSEDFEILVYSDGSTDGTEDLVRSIEDPRVRLQVSEGHEGKINCLNRAVPLCSGDIVVLTDVDALCAEDAVLKLIRYFADPAIGGVCGNVAITEKKRLAGAQGTYLRFDATLKLLESKTGSISANSGKLYAIRKELFQPIPEAVTDDLYTLLAVVNQGYRFLFAHEARAFIRIPSRSPRHEIVRRRRIVSTSLRGILLMKGLLNPWRHGYFAINLTVNKVIRRLLGIFLLLLLGTSLILAPTNPAIGGFLALQLLFYLLGASYYFIFTRIGKIRLITSASSLPFYFTVGNIGSLLGVWDCLRDKRIDKWDPVKTDPSSP